MSPSACVTTATVRAASTRPHSALKAEGTAVIEAWDPYGTHKKAAALTELLAPDGESRTSLTSDQHQQCPGHAAYVKASWQWDDEGNRVAVANVAYVCTDWKQNGHTQRYGSSSSTPSRDEMTDEQRDKARAQRRDVIESNKAWEASEPVRLAFLATFAARKTAPKGSAAFLARALTEHADVVGDVGGAALAAEWFKVSHPGYGGRLGAQAIIEKVTEGRALLIAACRVLADMEKHTSRESWRHVEPRHVHAAEVPRRQRLRTRRRREARRRTPPPSEEDSGRLSPTSRRGGSHIPTDPPRRTPVSTRPHDELCQSPRRLAKGGATQAKEPKKPWLIY